MTNTTTTKRKGGPQPGAGRPPKPAAEKHRRVTIYVSPTVAAWLGTFAPRNAEGEPVLATAAAQVVREAHSKDRAFSTSESGGLLNDL